jgi:hypothetical protein
VEIIEGKMKNNKTLSKKEFFKKYIDITQPDGSKGFRIETAGCVFDHEKYGCSPTCPFYQTVEFENGPVHCIRHAIEWFKWKTKQNIKQWKNLKQ